MSMSMLTKEAIIIISCLLILPISSVGAFSSPPSRHRHNVNLRRLAARGTRGYNSQRQEQQSRIRYDDDYGYDDDDDFYDDDDDDDDYYIQQERQTSSIECPHFGTCPGCVREANIAEIDIIESAKLFFNSPSVQKHILRDNRRYNNYYDDDEDDDSFYQIKIPSPITQWRTQAKLAVAPASSWSRAAGCKIGLYQRYSHDVLSIPDCKVHHPSINRAIDVITRATQTVRTPAYVEDTGEGLLRYVQCQVELSTGKVCLSLVMNAEKFKECQPHLSYLVKELKRNDKNHDLWHSIWVHCNDSRGNAIFARDAGRWHPVDGPPYLREGIPGSDPERREGLLYFSPHVFRQGNLEGFGEIAREVREAIPSGSRVCELYAGVGLLGLSALLHHGKQADAAAENGDGSSDSTIRGGLQWLRCSDENPENARCFDRAVNSMPKHITGRTPRKFQKNNKKRKGKGRNNKSKRGQNQQQSSSDELLSIKDLMDSVMAEDGGRAPPPENDPSERVTYLQANAASALYRGQALGADVLVVDPPRKGLDEAVLAQLCLPRSSKQPYAEKSNMLSHLPRHTINWVNDARTLIYVSCGFDALARDLDQLLGTGRRSGGGSSKRDRGGGGGGDSNGSGSGGGGGWKLESATGYVLFPGSNHVETVVVLRR